MNKETFISSGILELYVLGMSSHAETMQVEEMCIKYPELLLEIEAIENALVFYASKQSALPNNKIKEQLFESLSTEEKNTQQTINKKTNTPTIKTINWIQYAAAAAACVIIVFSVSMNLFLFKKLNNANGSISTLLKQNSVNSSKIIDNETKISSLTSMVELLSSSQTKRIVLKNHESINNSALVWWNGNNVFISNVHLPELPSGKQYQLWVIVNGQPQDMGVINKKIQPNSIQQMKSATKGSTFAITIEKEGGNQTPTLSSVVLSGAV